MTTMLRNDCIKHPFFSLLFFAVVYLLLCTRISRCCWFSYKIQNRKVLQHSTENLFP